MNKLSRITSIATSLVLVATFVGWRVHASLTRPNVQLEIVKDPSRSTTDSCETLVGVAEEALATRGVSSSSALVVLLVGDAASANEPIVLANYPIQVSTKAVESHDANKRRQGQVLGDLLTKCQNARSTGISPIFLGVKQGIADLRGRGCNTGSDCRVFIDSDLEENVEPSIKARLDGVRGGRPLPAVIDNSGIAVSFCGLAATTGGIVRDSGREDRIKATWRSLFGAPDMVTFRPYCPSSTHLAEYAVESQATR